MRSESSNGFASVGTVLPSEEAALLPGGLFLSFSPENLPPLLAAGYSLSVASLSGLLAAIMQKADEYLTRWQSAGLLNEQTATSIRAYEALQARPKGKQWQVLVALILGAILLAAGVLLFVAAHWEDVSPAVRLGMVLTMLVFFHGLGMVMRQRFSGFATAMHAVGTISAGAAIALVGQIFNMQEHWPAAVMLWAACAASGWLLLRDQFQQTLTLLLIPAWIVSEWSERTDGYSSATIFLARIGLVVGVVYLTAFFRSQKRAVFGVLFAVGAVLVPVSIGFLAEEAWRSAYGEQWGAVPDMYRFIAYGIMAVAVIAGGLHDRWSVPPALIGVGLAFALPWSQRVSMENANGSPYSHTEPNLLTYAMVAVAAILLVAWGVRFASKALVNYGMVAFALTVMWFYFSSVMDKLGRSLGLIGLGVLFLAGGWALEQTRRRLVQSMAGGVA